MGSVLNVKEAEGDKVEVLMDEPEDLEQEIPNLTETRPIEVAAQVKEPEDSPLPVPVDSQKEVEIDSSATKPDEVQEPDDIVGPDEATTLSDSLEAVDPPKISSSDTIMPIPPPAAEPEVTEADTTEPKMGSVETTTPSSVEVEENTTDEAVEKDEHTQAVENDSKETVRIMEEQQAIKAELSDTYPTQGELDAEMEIEDGEGIKGDEPPVIESLRSPVEPVSSEQPEPSAKARADANQPDEQEVPATFIPPATIGGAESIAITTPKSSTAGSKTPLRAQRTGGGLPLPKPSAPTTRISKGSAPPSAYNRLAPNSTPPMPTPSTPANKTRAHRQSLTPASGRDRTMTTPLKPSHTGASMSSSKNTPTPLRPHHTGQAHTPLRPQTTGTKAIERSPLYAPTASSLAKTKQRAAVSPVGNGASKGKAASIGRPDGRKHSLGSVEGADSPSPGDRKRVFSNSSAMSSASRRQSSSGNDA